jgi:hypothetical protein
MTEKLTISNINQFIGYARTTPALLNIGGLFLFRPYATVAPSAGCSKCSKTTNKLAEQRPQFEAALSTLTADEQSRLKALLNTKQLCFYIRQPGGILKQSCF